MTEPTDAEIWQMWMPMTRVGVADPVEFARAVLAKWGTPPAVAGEPVASVHSDTLAMLQSGQCRPWDGGAKLHPPGKARFDTAYTHLYTTPQPTKAQAGAVPLTDEQIQEAILPINPHGMGYFLRIARAIERAHGIGIKKGDSHA